MKSASLYEIVDEQHLRTYLYIIGEDEVRNPVEFRNSLPVEAVEDSFVTVINFADSSLKMWRLIRSNVPAFFSFVSASLRAGPERRPCLSIFCFERRSDAGVVRPPPRIRSSLLTHFNGTCGSPRSFRGFQRETADCARTGTVANPSGDILVLTAACFRRGGEILLPFCGAVGRFGGTDPRW